MHPQTQFIIAVIIAVIAQIAVVLSGLWASHAYSQWDKLFAPSSGKISGRILNDAKPFFLILGGNIVEISSEKLKKGLNLGQYFQANDKNIGLPIKMYEENNRLLFDIEIFNDNNELVCSIAGNEWQFNPDGKYDRNYSLNAFEIVDENLIPVIQIYLADENKIFVGGSIKTEKRFILLSPQATYYNFDKSKITEYIKRIFKYPSNNNVGKFEVANLPKFTEVEELIAYSAALDTKVEEFSKLSNTNLKNKAIELANSVEKLYQQYDSTEPSFEEPARINLTQPALDNKGIPNPEFKQFLEEYNKANTEYEQKKEEHHKKFVDEYKQKYKVKVDALAISIASRLLENSPQNLRNLKDKTAVEYRLAPMNSLRFQNIAPQLRELANNLPAS